MAETNTALGRIATANFQMAFTKLFYISPNVREVKKLKYKVLAMRLKRYFIL